MAAFGPVGALVFLICIAYAIVAHRLFDIRVIIKRTVIFAGLSLFVLGTYAAIIFVAASLFQTTGSSPLSAQQMIPNLVAALGIALGFEPLRKWLTIRTDKWLFKGEYSTDEVLRELSEALANIINLEDALNVMMHLVAKAMHLENAVILIVQAAEEHGEYELKRAITIGDRKSSSIKFLPHDPLVHYFLHDHSNKGTEHPGPVVAEELMRQIDEGTIVHERAKITADFLMRLSYLNGTVSLPLYINRQEPTPTPPGQPPKFKDVETFVGLLILGAKKSGDAFNDQDLRLLNIIATQTASAIEKARIYEEDQLKSEFVSIASHELLTPTAAMEGYLSMILDEGMGKIDKQAREYLEKVFHSSKRLASLVKDLLNVSRIERGKIVVHPVPMDLSALIAQTADDLQIRAKERNITLAIEKTKAPLPEVMGDAEKLTQVLVNLIGNGLKYTAKGSVTVSTEVKNNQVFVHVKDTGIGLKPADLTHLFTKFFRASNADQTGQTGTGLGLYITKHIIELMGGTLIVDSQINKGSDFIFNLPIATEADVKAAARAAKAAAKKGEEPLAPEPAPAPATSK